MTITIAALAFVGIVCLIGKILDLTIFAPRKRNWKNSPQVYDPKVWTCNTRNLPDPTKTWKVYHQ